MAEAKVQRGQFIEYQDGDVLEGGDEISDEEKAFQEFRNSLNAGEEMATVRVSLIPKSNITGHPTNAKSIYCFAYPVDRYTFEELCEFIRDHYGGGLYRLLGTKKGHRGAAFNQLLQIAEPIRPKSPHDGPSQPQNPSAVMESVAAMLTAAQERWEGMFTRLGAMGGNSQVLPPPADPFEAMQKMVTMLAAMGVIGVKPAVEGGGVVAELTKLAQIKELIGGFGDNGSSTAESNFYDLATQGLKTVAPLLANLPAVLASRQGIAPSAPTHVIEHAPEAQGPPRAPPPRNAPPPTPEPPNVNIKNQVDLLVMQAESGVTAETLCDRVLDMTPTHKLAELQAFLARPNVVDEMAALNPLVNSKHRAFFEALRTEILAALAAELAGPEASETATPV